MAVVKGHAGNEGVLLVETKSHAGELKSPATGAAGDRLVTIDAALEEVKQYLRVPAKTEWNKRYFQITSRLTFLYYLRVRRQLPAWLWSVYFLGDSFTGGERLVFPKTEQEWQPYIETAKKALELQASPPLSDFTHEGCSSPRRLE